jgi:murein DD-endopeptidase MepM/ murein hydrolase activator NlpD
LERTLRTAQAQPSSSRSAELRKAAQEFESIFVAYLFKVMRETIEEASGPESGGFGKTIYTELFDQEVSRTIARRGALGIADLMLRRLESPGERASPALAQPNTPAPPGVRPSPSVSPAEEDIPDTLMPVNAPVSSGFGSRSDPFSRQVKFHKGMDLAAPAGTTVQAVADGEVVFTGHQGGYGNMVVVRHGGGLESKYAHLGEVSVKVGDTVRPQTPLGVVGTTGRSTGPHLHFEVTRWGTAVDPRERLSE